jgi:hypothetical protein
MNVQKIRPKLTEADERDAALRRLLDLSPDATDDEVRAELAVDLIVDDGPFADPVDGTTLADRVALRAYGVERYGLPD